MKFYRDIARAVYGSDDIQIEDSAKLSPAANGCWVQAWVYLSNETIDRMQGLPEEDDAA